MTPSERLEAGVANYLAGMTMAQAARTARVEYKRLSQALRDRGLARPNQRDGLPAEVVARIVELGQRGMSIAEIERETGRTWQVIKSHLLAAGITPPSQAEAQRKFTDQQIEEWKAMYRDGLSTTDISKVLRQEEIQIQPGNLGKLLTKHGLTLREKPTAQRKLVSPETLDDWKTRYVEGYSLSEIAEATGWSVSSVRSHLRKAGVATQDDRLRLANRFVIPLDDHILTREWAESESGAWWIGMFVTDGVISMHAAEGTQQSPEVRILQKGTDADAVLCVARALGHGDSLIQWEKSSHYENYYSAYVRFRHPKFHFLIDECGFPPGPKSGKVVTPPFLLMNRHYWRGVIDGDGFVRIDPKKDYPYIGLKNDSYPILEEMVSFCDANGIHSRIYNGDTVRVWGDHARALARLLWKDVDFTMRRKWAIAHRMMRLEKPRSPTADVR